MQNIQQHNSNTIFPTPCKAGEQYIGEVNYMLLYYIVLNHINKEYWVAEPKYCERIEVDIQRLKSIYGDENISFYSTDIKNLHADLEEEKHKGYVANHYINWL